MQLQVTPNLLRKTFRTAAVHGERLLDMGELMGDKSTTRKVAAPLGGKATTSGFSSFGRKVVSAGSWSLIYLQDQILTVPWTELRYELP
ncbi:Hypothetical predicted protein [Podarcis lilfordi]|uniref:Uncharacterized protein n=1 Tax=Podarcis lilfordi TaxID=74358 RepID=A0AA35P3N8_9SAUR|nr:Hypothetical predicted protein [Podarcis lilfordi]